MRKFIVCMLIGFSFIYNFIGLLGGEAQAQPLNDNFSYLGTGINDIAINVKDYGAKGDGITDDTHAIQVAFDAANGHMVVFPPGKYKVTDTLTINPAKVRRIEGAGAYIKFASTLDIPLFDIVGSLTAGTADPSNSQTISLRDTEIMPIISGLALYSETRHYGTGFRIRHVFGAILQDLHIQGFKTGIEFLSHNRNVIISDCHIWDNSLYGIHFNEVSQHQTNITGCHISYSSKCIFVDKGDVHNLQIAGNDIEGNGSNGLIHLKATDEGTQVSQVQITGNSIEDHVQNTNPLIILEGISYNLGAGFAGIVTINGNEISGSATDAIKLSGVYNVAINGNTFFGNSGYSVTINNKAENIVISDNTVGSLSTLPRWQGLLKVENVIADVGNLIVRGNECANLMVNPLIINMGPYNLYECSIEGNILHFAYERPNGAPTLMGYALDIVSSGTLWGLRVQDNSVRMRNYCDNGVRVSGGFYSKVVIADNVIRGLPSGKTAYAIPRAVAGEIIVRDNI